jgi:hypothetical protein
MKKVKCAKVNNDIYLDGFNYNCGSCNMNCNSVVYLLNDTCMCLSNWQQIDAAKLKQKNFNILLIHCLK